MLNLAIELAKKEFKNGFHEVDRKIEIRNIIILNYKELKFCASFWFLESIFQR